MLKKITFLVLTLCGFQNFLHSEDVATDRPKVGLCIMATGRYTLFIEPLINSARKFFCTDCDVKYYVFTNGQIPDAPDIVRVQQERLGWPYDTMKRFHIYYANQELFKDRDYMYAIDADMRFILPVGREIFSDYVGTRHFGYTWHPAPYESNPRSRAYVSRERGKYYYAGALYGGKRECFLDILETVIDQVDDDLKNGFIATWHDESHLNRYFCDHPPTLMLPIEYCFPEDWAWPEKKIVDVAKSAWDMRQDLKDTDMIPGIWWDKVLKANPNILNEFRQWWGNEDAASRVALRRHIKNKNYHTVLDAGAGFGTDSMGFKKDGMDISYTGIDITQPFVDDAQKNEINVSKGDMADMKQFSDNQFDICYARHVIEHAENHKEVLKEMIRVASDEVAIAFFMKPSDNDSDAKRTGFVKNALLHHIRYSKPNLEAFLKEQPKVKSLQWQPVINEETILHIYLK